MSIRSEQIVLVVTTLLTIVTAFPISSRDATTTPNGQNCDKSIWETIILFYILNYGTHAFTIKSVPGESKVETAVWILGALFLPFTGVLRACNSIEKGKVKGENDLQHALRLGVLCEVVSIKRGSVDSVDIHKIHGHILVPEDYCFKILRDWDEEITFASLSGGSIKLSSTRNPLKAISAIVQLLFACSTLYRSRGDQLDKYGYAAFGLTVIPYAVMSFINLIANLTTPDYPALYLVRTEAMDDAEADGGKFVGAVATLSQRSRRGSPKKKSLCERALLYGAAALRFLAALAPYAIIGGLTGFKSQNSTSAQRGWTMAWLVVGQVFGQAAPLQKRSYQKKSVKGYYLVLVYRILVFGAPAIGGLVVVEQMIVADGYCESTG
jgi:hypothetical protein